MNVDDAFDKFTEYKHTKYGHEVNCVKGLFGVTAPDKDEAIREARHYFVQYYQDGEYS